MLGCLFLHGLADDGFNVGVALVGNDGFRVVFQLLFAVGNVLFQMGHQVFRQP